MRRYFAATTQRMEALAKQEIERFGAEKVNTSFRGVYFSCGTETLYKICYQSRLISRIFAPIYRFEAPDKDALYEGAMQVDWLRYFRHVDQTFAIDGNIYNSKINHSKYIALRVKDAVADWFRDRIGRRPYVETNNPDLRFHVHLRNDIATINFDVTNGTLQKRGYRSDSVEAPLSEHLAAACLDVSGWKGDVPFVDLMCGSGTFGIEAALLASQKPAGSFRKKWGFEQTPDFQPKLWRQVREAADAKIRSITAPIIGCDIDAAAVTAARQNARRAGFADAIEFRHSSFQDLQLPETPGVIFVNPPYGIRLGADIEEVALLYNKIGDFFKQKAQGWRAFVFTGNLDLVSAIRLKPSRRHIFYNGPLESRLLEYEIY